MKLRTLAATAFGLMLASSALAMTIQHSGPKPAAPAILAGSATVPLDWVPGWFMTGLRNAIADANDPRDRTK